MSRLDLSIGMDPGQPGILENAKELILVKIGLIRLSLVFFELKNLKLTAELFKSLKLSAELFSLVKSLKLSAVPLVDIIIGEIDL